MSEGAEAIPRELPFRAEYAKSGRAKCKHCSNAIDKDELRLAIMVKSFRFDGFQPNWFHFNCFFLRAKPKSVGDIAHFESLRWEDQKRIKEKIESGSGAGDISSAGSSKAKKANLSDYSVEYAKSSRATCPACEKPIEKQELRIGKKDYHSENALRFGPVFRWHHLDCFIKVREHLEFFEAGKSLPGYRDLEKEDKELIKSKLPEIKTNQKRKFPENGEVTSKKLKTEEKSDEDFKLEKMIEKQNKAMFKIRDEIARAAEEKQITKRELQLLFEHNKQEVPPASSMYDRLADIMTFGALVPCEQCKGGQYVYRSGVGYYCMGHLTEFTKCGHVTEDPKRVPFKIPRDLQVDDISFLVKYKPRVEKRVVPKHAKPTAVASTSVGPSTSGYKGPKINPTPLKKFKFFVDPTLDKNLAKKIESFGGKVSSSISSKSSIAAIISSTEQLDAGKEKYVKISKERKIPIVSETFVENIRDVDYNIIDQIQLTLIGDWNKPMDVEPHLKSVNPEFQSASKEEKSKFEREMKMVKLKMKDGAVVDPDSGLEDEGHVYKERKTFFAFVLSKVDVESGENKFYKLQLIESDRGKKYWVFRAWGRLGTTIGGNQTDPMDSLESAQHLFHKMYKDKTGNDWGKKFVKKPGFYTPMDIDFGEKKQFQKLEPSTKNSKLEIAVQNLVCKIFDVEDMQRTLLEFELDLGKMPLGKISKAQILQAYSILSETSKLLQEGPKSSNYQKLLVDVTNRFFTLVPHNFGVSHPPLLNDMALVKTKCEMLENMMEVEIAYELLMQGDKDSSSPVDSYYKKLKCSISTLERNSQMWQILETYLVNTHADTHGFRLEIDNIYAVDRKGEDKRYSKFKDLPNRMLLWHGSRTSNFAGILSQGLRIAPPEAPVTGYMFGKGIYFADMVSKSAQYCCPKRDNPSGLLLLCEVALGDMYELTAAKDTLSKPPKGKNSVKGLGATEPDPKEKYLLPGGTVVPYGKPVPAPVKKTSLLYNEYIVYDVNQVNILYVVETNFHFVESKRR